MIESILYWINEYHIDGFRFDLMGIHDIETMNEIRAAIDKIDPSIFMYGEGWAASSPQLEADKLAMKANVEKMPRIAAFSDEMRDGLRGSWDDDTKGALQGGMLVQTVENNVRYSITLQLNNNLHAVFKAGEVINLSNAFDYAVLSQVSNILNQISLVNLVGDFGNNDMVLALVGRHDLSLSANFYNAAAGVISTGNTFLTQNAGTGREVRTLSLIHI